MWTKLRMGRYAKYMLIAMLIQACLNHKDHNENHKTHKNLENYENHIIIGTWEPET